MPSDVAQWPHSRARQSPSRNRDHLGRDLGFGMIGSLETVAAIVLVFILGIVGVFSLRQ
jgi:hypothetical protein